MNHLLSRVLFRRVPLSPPAGASQARRASSGVLLLGLLLLLGGALALFGQPTQAQNATRMPAPVGSDYTAPGGGPTATSTPAACAPHWETVLSPNEGIGYNTLAGVAILSTNDAWAVGSYPAGGQTRPLALHWNGTVWNSVPITATGTSSNLQAVTALAANNVWAVGTSDSNTLIEHWNGTAWSVVPSPNGGPNGSLLWGVAAVAANDIWAVGTTYDAAFASQTLTLHWNGTVWTVIASPNTGGGSKLMAVAATAGGAVWAVGSYQDGSGNDQALSLERQGSQWVSHLGPTGFWRTPLQGVSILSPTDIWAVGTYQFSNLSAPVGLTLHWDGTVWSRVPSPEIGANSTFQGVAALAPDNVWAVGAYSNASQFQTLTQHWNGTSWSIVASPNVGGGSNTLNGVAASAGGIWAVGTDGQHTLITRFTASCGNVTPTPVPTGTPPCPSGWQIISSPNVLTTSNVLNGITTAGDHELWAVGSSSNGAHTLVLHWHGAFWEVHSSPDAGATTNVLQAVTALDEDSAWAVGYSGGPIPQTLILQWDGTIWRVIPSPNVGAGANRLFAVTVLAANDAWAVGTYTETSTGEDQTLTEHWNGLAWSVVTSPNGDPEGSFLRGVAALAANDVWAAGYTVHHDEETATPTVTATATTLVRGARQPEQLEHPEHAFEALFLHWDGTAWSVEEGPELPEQHFIRAVAAVASDDIWAVGYIGDSVPETLVEHWDGTEWSVVPSPNVGNVSSSLRGVTALSAGDVWAVGSYINNVGADQTLILHWNGTTWTVSPSPSQGSGNNILTSATVRSATEVWAAGLFTAVTGTQTLTERYSGPCGGGPTPTVTTTATPCPIQFIDVPSGSTFYDFIRCLACRGIVGGYPCGGPGEPCPGNYYRPNNNVTRGQVAKIISSSANFAEPIPSTQWTFQDVPVGSTFYLWIERLAGRGIIGGYPCGGAFEPCVAPGNRPYFRPNNDVTRGQLSKIVSGAAGYTETPTGQTFADVPPGSTFYLYVERIAARGIIAGYPCGGAGEPCVPPGNRPYFRPNNSATRGQTAKIVTSAFLPNCQTPARR